MNVMASVELPGSTAIRRRLAASVYLRKRARGLRERPFKIRIVL
jgi:hypothetical protein